MSLAEVPALVDAGPPGRSLHAGTQTMAKVQRALALTGPLMVLVWIVAFVVLARFIPPPSPELSAPQVLHRYTEHRTSLQLGLALTLFASALLVPFSAAISTQMRRIEGPGAPLALTQVCSAALLSLEFIVPIMVWQAAAFRPDAESVRFVQTLNDMGWLMFVAVISSVMAQIASFGAAILLDPRPEPVFPRWAAYFNFWVTLVLAPAGLVVFFKHGPLAWTGIFGFWLPLSSYVVWMGVTYVLLRRAIAHQEREEAGWRR